MEGDNNMTDIILVRIAKTFIIRLVYSTHLPKKVMRIFGFLPVLPLF